MKHLYLLILFLLMLGTLPAQTIVFQTEWEQEINSAVLRDRLIVEFREGTPNATQQMILQLVGLNFAYSMPRPNIVVAKIPRPVADYRELKSIISSLQQYNNVKLACVFMYSSGVHPIGVLSNVAVKVLNDNALQEMLTFAEQNHLYPVYQDAYMANVWWINTNKFSTYNALEAAVMLNQSGLFEYAEPNYLVSPKVPSVNDQFYNRQWSINNNDSTIFPGTIMGTPGADMSVDSAWTVTTGSSFIKVAVLDSGVDTLHPDLVNTLVPGYDATGGGSKGYPNLDKSSNAHGTACAGIIGAQANNGIGIAGVAHGVKIIPIKVFYYIDTTFAGTILQNIPYSTSQWFANAINWAWRDAEADVMSNSWGLDNLTLALLEGSPSLVEDAITAAADSGRLGLGTPLLFSSGNDDTAPIWPAKLTQTIAVNATSMCDERKTPSSCDRENWTGCWGNGLEVSAPGVKITTCDISGVIGYSAGDYTFDFNGTSAACPNAAAVVALMLSIRPDLSYDAVRYLLGTTADRVGGYDYNQTYSGGSWSRELGYGRVNAYKAVLAAEDYTNHGTGIASSAETTMPVQLYPNPFYGQQLTLEFEMGKPAPTSVNIIGLDGRTVYTQSLGNTPSGASTHHITISHALAPGAYMVGLTTGSQTSYTKLVVLNQQ